MVWVIYVSILAPLRIRVTRYWFFSLPSFRSVTLFPLCSCTSFIAIRSVHFHSFITRYSIETGPNALQLTPLSHLHFIQQNFTLLAATRYISHALWSLRADNLRCISVQYSCTVTVKWESCMRWMKLNLRKFYQRPATILFHAIVLRECFVSGCAYWLMVKNKKNITSFSV